MSNIVYYVDDVQYDVNKLSVEGQRAFNLLAIAEQRVQEAQSNTVIAQAAAVALHEKMKEYLTDEAIIQTEDTSKE